MQALYTILLAVFQYRVAVDNPELKKIRGQDQSGHNSEVVLILKQYITGVLVLVVTEVLLMLGWSYFRWCLIKADFHCIYGYCTQGILNAIINIICVR